MAQTLYASFPDASLAEKAAGALLDHGVQADDISLVTQGSDGNIEKRDFDNADTINSTDYRTDANTGWAGNRAEAGAAAAGNRVAQAGDQTMADVSGAVGAQNTAANYQSAANMRDAQADMRSAQASGATTDYNTTTLPATDTTDHTSRTDTASDTELAAKSGLSTTTGQDAGVGAAKGAGIGLGLGVLAALASLAVPGVGLVTGGGALAMAIGAAAGATAGGAVAGGVYGYLVDQGVPTQVAQNYNQTFAQGGAILAVHCPSGDVDQATIESTLSKYGATNVNTYGA